MKITLAKVASNSEIYFRTQRSVYRFKVTSPELRSGVLSGGPLGRRGRRAFLAATVFPNADRISDSQELLTGGRAIFYVAGKRGAVRLTTSVIAELGIAEDNGAATSCLEAA